MLRIQFSFLKFQIINQFQIMMQIIRITEINGTWNWLTSYISKLSIQQTHNDIFSNINYSTHHKFKQWNLNSY